MDKSLEFERRFLFAIEKIRKSRDIKRTELCKNVWSSSAKPDQIWQRLMKGDSKAKNPQKVSLKDAYKLSDFLGYELPDLIWRIYKEIEFSEKKDGRRWDDTLD